MNHSADHVENEPILLPVRKAAAADGRTPERLSHHYAIERRLAAELRQATKEERRRLYREVYDELFRSVPDHPQLVTIADPVMQKTGAARRARSISQFFTAGSTFLEIGPGDCALALEVARSVRRVFAVDVSAEITQHIAIPENFELILSDGSSIAVPPGTVDVAYSDQVMEHLHPDDAVEQLQNVFKALKPGGVYLCVTPNRFSGPHDISKYFTDEPTGFHLKEHSTTDLVRLLKGVGFRRVDVPVPCRGETLPIPCTPSRATRYLVIPSLPAMVVEAGLAWLPRRVSRWVASRLYVRWLFNRVLAVK